MNNFATEIIIFFMQLRNSFLFSAFHKYFTDKYVQVFLGSNANANGEIDI